MYEILYIVSSKYTDPEVEGIMKKMAELITQAGGKVERNESLGKIKLAYPIKHMRHGTYVLVHFFAEAAAVRDLERRLRMSEEILRHTMVKLSFGAEKRKFEITSYVAPLSEEAKEFKAAPHHAPAVEEKPPVMQPVAVVPANLSMAELDKKLDEILEEPDFSGKV